LLIVVLAALLATTSPFDGGGSVEARLRLNDTSPIRGVCASACTARLATAACIAPDAMLGFHAAFAAGRLNALATLELAETYRPQLRTWFYSGDLGVVRWKRGAEMEWFGYRVCS
jgi:hypothetical protein